MNKLLNMLFKFTIRHPTKKQDNTFLGENRTTLTINQTAESNDHFGAEIGEKFLDSFFDDAILLVFITAKLFFTAGLLE